MWFEILPGAVIITTLLSVPIYAMYGLQKLTIGNAFRRNMDDRFGRVMYQRDFRLTDNPYKMNGLEQIPDEEEEKEQIEEPEDPALLKKREKERKQKEKQRKEEEKLREKQLKEEEKQKKMQ
ncbi:glutamic acid-rich protein isoform X1 [Drosophila rhopaloa]|uniref:NADH dehydrogenase [ubiquinone] 1 alpha subcomplex subunit 1 n=1 Tax=Drosophila rhopaloa TaxID=1041015 RepID=A0A6P4F3D2_DRORH|nr:glutamic acid-rich protein isoform X1 [Drosophila rhopaloa]